MITCLFVNMHKSYEGICSRSPWVPYFEKDIGDCEFRSWLLK